MSVDIEKFHKRWDTISSETLSAVRRQFKAYSFDNTTIEKAFRDGCAEWFGGGLGPQVWYDELEREHPEITEKFKDYVTNIRLDFKSTSRPSRVLGYALTVLSLPVCYFSLTQLTDMGELSKALTTVGVAILVWYASLASVRGKEARQEENLTDFYRAQLNEHFKALKTILS